MDPLDIAQAGYLRQHNRRQLTSIVEPAEIANRVLLGHTTSGVTDALRAATTNAQSGQNLAQIARLNSPAYKPDRAPARARRAAPTVTQPPLPVFDLVVEADERAAHAAIDRLDLDRFARTHWDALNAAHEQVRRARGTHHLTGSKDPLAAAWRNVATVARTLPQKGT